MGSITLTYRPSNHEIFNKKKKKTYTLPVSTNKELQAQESIRPISKCPTGESVTIENPWKMNVMKIAVWAD